MATTPSSKTAKPPKAPAKCGAESSLLRPLVEDLQERRERIRMGGGEEKIARQHEQDKLTARERLALLIDEGTFVELGMHARPHFSQRAMEGRTPPPTGSSPGTGRSTDAWRRCAPTTSPSWPGRWG